VTRLVPPLFFEFSLSRWTLRSSLFAGPPYSFYGGSFAFLSIPPVATPGLNSLFRVMYFFFFQAFDSTFSLHCYVLGPTFYYVSVFRVVLHLLSKESLFSPVESSLSFES